VFFLPPLFPIAKTNRFNFFFKNQPSKVAERDRLRPLPYPTRRHKCNIQRIIIVILSFSPRHCAGAKSCYESE